MMFSNIQDVLAFCRKEQIQMIDFKMVDIDGRWRHVTIPAERFDETVMTAGIGFDAANYGYASIEMSDMAFIPDLATAALDPFVRIPTLSMTGDVYVIGKNNVPFDQYARCVARKAEHYMRSEGVADDLYILPEFEYYLFDHVSYEVSAPKTSYHIDSGQAHWNSGGDTRQNLGYVAPFQGNYHIDLPNDSSFDLRNETCRIIKNWGIDVKYHHPEVGSAGQFEIEVELQPLSVMLDKIMAVRYIVKNAARAAGKTATLMPKPVYGEAGSSMHIHMLMRKDGKSIFADDSGYSGLSRTAHYFMGGILRHLRSLCGFTNPSTNSYKRLVPGFEAPVTIAYANSNRSAAIRIPSYAKAAEVRRFELRTPDSTCNPYFAGAAILMAGLDGIRNRIDPSAEGWGPFDCNLYDLSPEEKAKLTFLPKNLDEALDCLQIDYDYLTCGGVFPKALIDTWVTNKRAEAKRIGVIPHPAEFLQYFDF